MATKEWDSRNSGALFQNTNKKQDNHPDRQGSLNVNGVDYWISGWLKKDKAGKPFLSLSVKPKEEVRQSSEPTRRSKQDDFDDDCPF